MAVLKLWWPINDKFDQWRPCFRYPHLAWEETIETIEKETSEYFQWLHFWNQWVPLIKMHCRVRYSFDFDLKICSGQVWMPKLLLFEPINNKLPRLKPSSSSRSTPIYNNLYTSLVMFYWHISCYIRSWMTRRIRLLKNAVSRCQVHHLPSWLLVIN